MKFNELKEQIQLGVNVSELINFEYVPLMSQKIIIDNIKSICLKEDNNGILSIDYVFKNLFTLLYVSVNFTNIEFEELYDEEYNLNSNFAFEIYDLFKEYKIDKFIFNQDDCKDFVEILENDITQEINIKNSVSSVLSQVLNSIAGKLPSENSVNSLIGDLPALLNSFNQQVKKKTPSKKNQG